MAAVVVVQRRKVVVVVVDGAAASEAGRRCAGSREFGDHLRWSERPRRLL